MSIKPNEQVEMFDDLVKTLIAADQEITKVKIPCDDNGSKDIAASPTAIHPCPPLLLANVLGSST